MSVTSELTPEPSAAASAVGSSALSACLASGLRWQGRYGIEAELPASGGGVMYAGVRIKDGVAVRLRRLSAANDSAARRQVWQLLCARPLAGGPRLLESVDEDDGRVEVWQHLDGPTLEERLATARLVTEDVAELVRPLAQALAGLHDRGLVYLQLGAERVVLPESLLGEAQLARIEMSVPLDGGHLVAVPTDPTRMPPEALGLYRLPADEGLKAWDWWTLGRLIQELWLGRTVMAHVLGRDFPRTADMVRRHAETMLKELDVKDPRAGGVEHMTDLPVQVRTLLRGLLTSVRDARWGAREVTAWLDGETPVERYAMARTTVLVKFHEEHLTVAEVAERLLSTEHWCEGVGLWGAAKPEPGTLLDVVARTRTSLHAEREWLTKLHELAEHRSLTDLSKGVRDEILSALAWTGLAGKGATVRWRGLPLVATTLTTMLAETDGRERLLGWLSRGVIAAVKLVDADTAWALDTWSRQVEQVQALAAKHEWVTKKPANENRLLALALAEPATLDQLFTEARARYRMSTVEPVQAMFGLLRPTFVMQALLALSFENAKACGYLTFEAWRAMELARLQAKGARLAEAMAAVRLAETLRRGVPVFGKRWRWRALVGGLLALTALFWPGWVGLATALGLAAGLAVGRRLLRPVVQAHLVEPEAPDRKLAGAAVEPWSWGGAVTACRHRARRALDGGGLMSVRQLQERLLNLNREIEKLGITPPPKPVLATAADERLVAAAWGGWLVVGLMLAGLTWRGLQPEWNLRWAGHLWRQDLAGLAVRVGLAEPAVEDIPVVKIDWPHKQTVPARGVTVLRQEEANDDQQAVAAAFAAEIERLYRPETLQGVIAISVPTMDDVGCALVLLDVAAGKPVDGFVYRMAYTPLRGTWMKIANRDVMYLNAPQ